jgi:eukaryotic-like serine/threonine-protein kinase
VGLSDWFKKTFGGKKGDANLKRIDVKKRLDLLGRTGQGSMSKVWRARDLMLGRTVCVKLLDKEKTAKFEARFPGTMKKPKEGEICLQFKHHNVVQTFEYGITTTGEYYLIMELIDGMGLNYLIETKSPQLEGNRNNFLIQMADAVEYIHKQGFLHRDLCPRNVMVTKENVVKVIDFGLAVPNLPAFRKPGNRTGTPNYLAPELIRRVTTDLRVDLFALGVTAFEVFTGDLPWEKSQSLQTLLSHMNTAPKDPRELRPDLDDETAKFLKKAVEREPNHRFQTAADFREALKALTKMY